MSHFVSGAGSYGAALPALIKFAVLAVLFFVVAEAVVHIWVAHQDGRLSGTAAGEHWFRAGVLLVFALVILVAW